MTIQVTNISERDLPGPVTLSYPDRTQVTEFGEPVLAVGESQSWEGPWEVTQAQLDEGRITFVVQYSYYTESGSVQAKTLGFSRRVTQVAGLPETEINRTVVPGVASEGQSVTVTYEILNVGTVNLENVTITEDAAIASAPAELGTIAPGEQVTYTFTFTMGPASVASAGVVGFDCVGQSYQEEMLE